MALSTTILPCSAILMACSVIFFLLTTLLPGTIPTSVDTVQRVLTLSPSLTFKLAIFSDLHYGEEENGWGIDQDLNSTRVMHHVLFAEAPDLDLVVLNGDLITGENTFRENSSAYIHQIVAPMVSGGIPWASTYGNHDSKLNLSRERTYAVEKTYVLSCTRQTDGLLGITNYYLILYRGMKPVAVLWFFDSRGGATYRTDPSNQDDIPNWVAPETAAWFRAEASALRKRYGGVLPSLVFVHIPPAIFLTAQRRGVDPAVFPGLNEDVPVAIQGMGAEDSQFVDALREEWAEGGLHSVYVGHDHGNAWCSTWPDDDGVGESEEVGDAQRGGPVLCFGKHTGYGGYGSWDHGSRIVQLSFVDKNGDSDLGEPGDMEVETWVRMESGEVITRVVLNETYGKDRYPTANGKSHG